MKKIVSWLVDNRIAANLLMWLLLLGGTLTAVSLNKEFFPELTPEFVNVSIIYPGATPEEIERSIAIKVEEEIQDLDGIDELSSNSSEGVGLISVKAQTGYSIRKLLDDVKARVDAIDTFPEDAEKPVIQEIVPRHKVISVAIYGQIKDKELKKLGNEIRDEMLSLPGVTKVDFTGERNYEIAIEVSPEKLKFYGLTIADISNAIASNSQDIPAGSIRGDQKQILVRSLGQAYVKEDFENIEVRSSKSSRPLKIVDVATVKDDIADIDKHSYFNGKPAAILQVFRLGDEDALQLARTIKDYVEKKKTELPNGIGIDTWHNVSVKLQGRVDTLIKNGAIGITLVFLVLALFLRLSLAFWVTLGIPISFLGTFLIMPELGITVNMISLFGFILVLGIVVDDAIVVGESIYSEIEKGKKPKDAAIEGTLKVLQSVVFAILTTIAAFYAMTAVPGNFGVIFGTICFVVIWTLVFSLVESLIILPVHLAHDFIDPILTRFNRFLGSWNRFQKSFTKNFDEITSNFYQPLLKDFVNFRYLALSLAFSILIVSICLVKGGWIRFSFFPDVQDDYISAGLTLTEGTGTVVTTKELGKIERAAMQLKEELADEYKEEVITNISTAIGSQPFRAMQDERGGAGSENVALTNSGEVTIELIPAEERRVGNEEITKRWINLSGEIPFAEELDFTSALISSGEPINVEISGEDFAVLSEVAEIIKKEISKYNGTYEISDTYKSGKSEIKIELNDHGRALGLDSVYIGRQVRQAFYGEEAERIQRARDDIKVLVRYPSEYRKQQSTIENFRIRLANGKELPLHSVAKVEEGKGFSNISRFNRKRTVNVTANVFEGESDPRKILANFKKDLFPKLEKDYPGISFSLAGQDKELTKTKAGLIRGFIIAMLIIYALIAIPFRSYLQPIIIMLAIPFGFIGALIGHLLIGIPVTIMSLFGFVALSGVVVNDGILLVNFINYARRDGLDLFSSIIKSGRERLRPVLITSISTFAGLLPMIFEQSMQAQFLVPIAVTLAFGVAFATFITLLVVPALYMVLEDLKGVFLNKSN